MNTKTLILNNRKCIVYEDGRVYILPFSTLKGNYKGHFAAQRDNGHGYISCTVNRKKIYTHRIIAMAFIPNPENKPQVNHINNIRSDNRIENLEWCTIKENIAHCIKQNRQRNGKIFLCFNEEGMIVGEFKSFRHLEQNVTNCSKIYNVITNKQKLAFGLHWMYKTEYEKSNVSVNDIKNKFIDFSAQPIKVTFKDGTVKIYESMNLIIKNLGINISVIKALCSGKKDKHESGIKCEYLPKTNTKKRLIKNQYNNMGALEFLEKSKNVNILRNQKQQQI
jgi:hypothetical protein